MKRFGSLIAIAGILCCSVPPANAQDLPVAQMKCKGAYAGISYDGSELADLWPYAGSTTLDTAGERRQLGYYLQQGEIHQIPGTVNLFTEMLDGVGNLVNFEVFLQQLVRGTG